ncbi:MAG: choice-of-anchor J domain-containing protein, partial [Muribaculaceae bacterium]|nr:choice-of-anchor J domain-containing protein [Muribaculaceae bacterium]
MKKLFLIAMTLILGVSAIAQQKIQLRSADRAECVRSDMTSLRASFSFSTIDAQDYESERGTFSWLSLPNTVLGGNVGEPQIPVINELIAVPFGANPRIEITSFSTTDYRLEDFGIHTLVPRQLPVRKSQNLDEVPFVMNEAAYQSTRGLSNEPTAVVSVEGTMRGVQLGTMTIEPVSYDPVSNTIRVFNDIEVTVHFEGANVQATEDKLLKTYSPAFEPVYAQLFNGRAVTDVYSQHPDLYNTPVRMLVICYSGFQGNEALNSWLQWKLQKGYDVDIFYTSETGTTSSAIASFIKTKYNASVSAGNAYTYLIVIGDTGQVPQYMTKTIDSDIGQCASDLGYASVNFSTSTSNYFPDMYYSRISVENTTHLTNYINKVLTYEKYQMTDGGNYLNNVILVGGWDSNWTPKVAKPTINYGSNYYFKSSNTTYGGFENGTIEATVSTSSTAGYAGSATGTSTTMGTGVYTSINSGVGFLNYTAHGDKQEWYQPKMTAAQVAHLTNSGKYFFGIGNCCLTGNFNNTTTTYSPGSAIGTNACFAETMIRVPNAGAVAYIGCSPYSYWYEDFYWAVGAHSYSQGNYPTTSASSTGVYDAMFIDGNWNSASALLYLGNLAVQQAVTNGNTNSSVTDGDCNNSAHYYFQFYHTFGDGSVMPYVTKPETNTVTLPSMVTPGTTSITVNALAGSYVAVTDNSSVIYGVAEADSQGVATVNFTNAIPNDGTLYVVVTRQQYQPYFGTISVIGGEQYNITATANPTAGGTVEGAGQYYENTECTLTATANHGYAFDHWSNNSTDNPLTFTVTGNASYTANFRQLTLHHMTFNPQQDHGTIGVSPANAYAGDIVTLTATPAAGYCLHAWHVIVGREEIPVVNNQFTMPDSDVTITAEFRSGYTITVATVANGTITASTTSALDGETITLTATPNTGCEFSTWYVYKTGDPNTLVAVVNNTFAMPSYDVTVSAVFATTSTGDVTIGSGTATNNGQYLPSYTYYNYSLTQQIYTVAEVGEAGTITAIAFQVSNSKAATRTLDIYMVPTTKDAFTSTTGWEVLSSAFKVYSGSVSFSASGWTTITLDTPYEYDGVKNLCVGVVDNTGSYLSSGNYPYFYTYSTSANRALRVYNDDNAYNVGTSGQITQYTGTQVQYNNQIKLTKVTKNNETLTVSPEAINDFSYLMGMGPTEAQAVSIVGADLSNDITVTAPTDFEVSTSATGTYSQSVTIPRATGSKGGRSVTSWGFEGSFDNWTSIDNDADGYGWVLGSATSNVYLEDGSNVTDQVSGHNSSTDMMVSGSWTDATTTELHPDNWLVSPQLELGGSFSLWAKPFYTTYPLEHFGIYVSTTSNSDPNAFTLLGEWTLGADDWKQFSADLHAYQGQNGYIAVRHFNGDNQFLILLDDFELDTDAAYNPEFPVTITSASVYVRMKADLNIGDYSGNMTVASGTLNKTVALSGIVEPNGGEQYDITVVASPTEGGTVTGAGTYYEQSRVTLTATPATHYTFEGWQLNGTTVSTSASYQITVTGDATYTAVFAPMTAHNVAITQPTGGAITSDLATAYAGDVVTVTYTVVSGYFFVEWSVVDGNSQPVAVTTSDQSGQFTMPDSDVTVTATFTTGYSITLNQTEHGTISADQTTQLQPGAVVTLTATPDNGCVFVAWYAYKTGNPRDVVAVISNQYILMPSSDVTVQAIFVTEEEHEANMGSGTSTNNYIPTYTRAKYSLTQQIYLATELAEALDNQNPKGRITKIAYRAGRSATRNLTIYMAHTDKSEFSSTTDWEVMGSVAKVFEGSVAFSNSGWTTITLDTPFEYDGTSNINICVVDNSNSTTTQNTGFYYYNGTNRALYANGSSSYANTVGYSNQLSSTTGTRISYVSQVHITMMVPGSAESLTLSPGEMADFSYVENHGPSHTNKLDIVGVDLANNITLNAPTNFEISLTENGTYASSATVPRETGSKGNRTVTSWDFEDGLQGWTLIDADGDGYNWAHNTSFGGHNESTGLVYSQSYDNSAGALNPDNWMISPQVELGGSFSMWAHPQQSAYPAEHFGIYVSTTGTNPSDFTLLDEWTLSSANWKQFSVDLGLYTGQQGYIAVRHFNCSDQFYINVDDFELDTDASITIEMPVVITPATVYTRMKSGLNPGNYTGTITGTAGTGDNLNGSVSLSGEVIAEYDITVAANPAAGGNVRGAGSYAAGTEITVRAAANTNYNFVNWTENGTTVSTSAEYTFTVTADRDLVANFVRTYEITATANPTAGGSATVSGTGTFAEGSEVTLTATANTGYTFINWTLNGVQVSDQATYTFNATADGDYVANFAQMFSVTASANPIEGGTVSGAGTFADGSTVTLTAAPLAGYSFGNWTLNGNVVSESATYTFTLSSATAGAYVANFELNSYAITTSVSPANSGTVSGAGTYNHGATATLTATPATGYSFVNWSDGVTTNPRTVTVTGVASYTANFAINQYTVTFLDEDGTVLKEATAYDYGTLASEIVKPADPTKPA